MPGTSITELPAPACIAAVLGDTDRVIADTVTVADPDLELSATEMAFTVTAMSLVGGVVGAV
jgi:hypothetical protein